ncbi:MAG: molybdopterin molybdotransferase MoeA [Deltaproteobacteria bacterium]|nr:molybdopterin molybdotransferase MoeA [Deltaproteobacteria bacterium]MBW1908970.1 molybdopterin molybdotransferase MoeA [Deltaproteobacteria bacterium]MBW2033877.1 molybdopterin molybdotransferase MoeA [Deltaproteobacteria bacterium]MBW2114385.1 molybdopterin molybdotransferase MoeA [Deltaproteobacteria bacterium]MBW2169406.1 molybdopterin molybdotransferase MoeA [Deltaproteobacteria bacterium]
MESFFKVKRPEEVLEIIDQFGPSGEEQIPLEQALGRVLSKEMIAPENLPDFFRSTMDGYAVQAKGTFGASESIPALFYVSGEVLMGQAPEMVVSEGQAVKISTGGMLPEGADGVVMVEYCHLLDENTLEISRTISPLENVIQPADDFGQGDVVFKKGRALRTQDLGLMAGFGQSEITVYKKPKIAIISTGDEIVAIDEQPLPGQVRDINRYTLSAFCRRVGAEPLYLGLCPDDFEKLKDMVEKALARADTVWLSGGSSVGTRDLTLKVFEILPDFELLVHGISISPGKPTIIGKSGSQPVIGLPGHVASALVVAEVFLTRLVSRLSGRVDFHSRPQTRIEAELSRNVESASGREDYIRVKLFQRGDTLIAEPIFGKSGLLSTLIEADGLIRVDMNTEGLYQGQKVKVILFDAINGDIR